MRITLNDRLNYHNLYCLEKCNSSEIQKSKKVKFRKLAQEKSHLPKTCKEAAGKNLTKVKEEGVGDVNEGSSKEIYPQKSQPCTKKSTKVVGASSLNESYWDSLFRTVIADTYQEVESFVQKQEGQLTCHSKEDRDIVPEDVSLSDTTAACKQNWNVVDSDLSSETIASSATEKAVPVDSGTLEKVDSASQVSKFSLKVKVQDPSNCIQIKDIFEDKSRKSQTAPRKKRKPPKVPSSQKWKRKVGCISLSDELDSTKYDYEELLIGGVGEPEVSPNTACIKEEVAKLIEEVDEILWVQCDDCKKWRKLDHTLDPSTLPKIWTCSMAPTVGENSCHIPEENWNHISEAYTYNDYVMGSVVWARVPGTAWWPAMVDIDPDYMVYFWLNKTLATPTSYHVTYFGEPVLRAWVTPRNMKAFSKRDTYKRFTFGPVKDDTRVSSLKAAVEDARIALTMDFDHRRKMFAFIFRYPGKLGKKQSRNSSHCSPQSDETKRKVSCVDPKQKERSSSQQSLCFSIISEEKKDFWKTTPFKQTKRKQQNDHMSDNNKNSSQNEMGKDWQQLTKNSDGEVNWREECQVQDEYEEKSYSRYEYDNKGNESKTEQSNYGEHNEYEYGEKVDKGEYIEESNNDIVYEEGNFNENKDSGHGELDNDECENCDECKIWGDINNFVEQNDNESEKQYDDGKCDNTDYVYEKQGNSEYQEQGDGYRENEELDDKDKYENLCDGKSGEQCDIEEYDEQGDDNEIEYEEEGNFNENEDSGHSVELYNDECENCNDFDEQNDEPSRNEGEKHYDDGKHEDTDCEYEEQDNSEYQEQGDDYCENEELGAEDEYENLCDGKSGEERCIEEYREQGDNNEIEYEEEGDFNENEDSDHSDELYNDGENCDECKRWGDVNDFDEQDDNAPSKNECEKQYDDGKHEDTDREYEEQDSEYQEQGDYYENEELGDEDESLCDGKSGEEGGIEEYGEQGDNDEIDYEEEGNFNENEESDHSGELFNDGENCAECKRWDDVNDFDEQNDNEPSKNESEKQYDDGKYEDTNCEYEEQDNSEYQEQGDNYIENEELGDEDEYENLCDVKSGEEDCLEEYGEQGDNNEIEYEEEGNFNENEDSGLNGELYNDEYENSDECKRWGDINGFDEQNDNEPRQNDGEYEVQGDGSKNEETDGHSEEDSDTKCENKDHDIQESYEYEEQGNEKYENAGDGEEYEGQDDIDSEYEELDMELEQVISNENGDSTGQFGDDDDETEQEEWVDDVFDEEVDNELSKCGGEYEQDGNDGKYEKFGEGELQNSDCEYQEGTNGENEIYYSQEGNDEYKVQSKKDEYEEQVNDTVIEGDNGYERSDNDEYEYSDECEGRENNDDFVEYDDNELKNNVEYQEQGDSSGRYEEGDCKYEEQSGYESQSIDDEFEENNEGEYEYDSKEDCCGEHEEQEGCSKYKQQSKYENQSSDDGNFEEDSSEGENDYDSKDCNEHEEIDDKNESEEQDNSYREQDENEEYVEESKEQDNSYREQDNSEEYVKHEGICKEQESEDEYEE
ncbi:uncharacterized protein [Panulirus ornatus]|uniref:uncharacterized protein isoform X2 n=1 Tax=Panulirus ornatus TaxID=150431 RepID=UPI003A8A4032